MEEDEPLPSPKDRPLSQPRLNSGLSRRGSILVLSRAKKIDQAQTGYQLCECWLDNHLFVQVETETIATGTSYEVEMSLVLTRTPNLDEDLEALGRRILEAGELVLWIQLQSARSCCSAPIAWSRPCRSAVQRTGANPKDRRWLHRPPIALQCPSACALWPMLECQSNLEMAFVLTILQSRTRDGCRSHLPYNPTPSILRERLQSSYSTYAIN